MKKELMLRTIELARENVKSGKGGPFAALIVKDGKVIGEGVNRVTILNDPTAHAEIQAIRDACNNIGDFSLSGCEVYTSCEPCPMCMGAILWSRADKIYYGATQIDAAKSGFDDMQFYEEFTKSPEHRKIKMENMCRTEAIHIFSLWDKSPNKVDY